MSNINANVANMNTRAGIDAAAAAFGASGVTVSGSPLAVMASLSAKGELNRQLTLYQGKVAAQADLSEGAIQTAARQAAGNAALIKAGGSLLTGTATFAKAASTLFSPTVGDAGTSPAAGLSQMATVSTFDVTEHAPIERPPLADPGDAAAFPDVDNATAIGLLLIEAGEQAEADAIAAGLDAARLDGEGETAPAASVVHLLRTCELAELIGRHGDGK